MKSGLRVVCSALGIALLTGMISAARAQSFQADEKGKVTGIIRSRSGDLINVSAKKTGMPAVVVITEDTKIERKKDFHMRRADMDVTAMVPGLTIEVEGVGNNMGQLAAKKITFDPDEFSIQVAEEQQIIANKSATSAAQSTANQGVTAAGAAQSSANQAQSSANQAQSSANQAGQMAVASGAVAITDAQAIQMVNTRVSDLGDYKTIEAAGVFFDTGQYALSADDKAALDKLAKDAASIDNYMIEVAGYASSTGTASVNEQLSNQRAAAVTDYLRNTDSVPMRRILVPAGYGATHPVGNNATTLGRDINQRVDVKVIVNQGLAEGMS